MAARFSFVVPVHNEADALPELESRLRAVMGQLDGDSEVIVVDDGSVDRSPQLLQDIHERDPRFKIVRFTRNFGHQVAVTAGLDFASGDAAIVMDGDLQDPPELALELVARWRQGYEVVYGVRSDRTSEPLLRRSAIKVSYRLLNRFANVELPEDAGDFRLLDRRVLDQLRRLRESNRYVRGLVAWTGFRAIGVPYVRGERRGGRSNYPLAKLITLGVDGLLGFSRAPLTIAVVVGFVVSLAAFVLGIVAIALRVAHLVSVPGWASVVVIMAFLGGVQLIVTGMVGTYVGRIYEEVKHRPLYVIRETRGIAVDALPAEPPTAELDHVR